jgi:hypothetical protein
MLKKWLHALEEGQVSLEDTVQSETSSEEIASQLEFFKELVLKLHALGILGNL